MAERKVRIVSNPDDFSPNPRRGHHKRRRRHNPVARTAPVIGKLSTPTGNEVVGVLAGATGGTVITGFARSVVSNVSTSGGNFNEVVVIGLAAITNFFIGAFSGKAIKGKRGDELGSAYVMGATAVHALQLLSTFGWTNILGIQLPQINSGAPAPTSGVRRSLPAGRSSVSSAVRPSRSSIPAMAGPRQRSGVGSSSMEEDGMFIQAV